MKHLLKLEDWSTEEIINTLNLADQLKYEQKHGIEHKILKGKSLGMIFEKSSTRTRVSFEDTARVLSRFLDGIMIRTFEQKEVEALAEYGSIPIINGLTDYCHPCQVLADLMTIREFKGKLEGLKMCFIGDGNNMMNSLIVGALSTGMSFSAACPKDYMPPKHIIEFGEKYGNGKFEIVTDPLEAAKNADIVYTDVWASMGQEEEKKIREAAFAGYQVNKELMAVTNNDCMVLHCLPAHRGEEITADVFEEHANEIFEEAENRLHAQKAVLVECMADEMPEKV